MHARYSQFVIDKDQVKGKMQFCPKVQSSFSILNTYSKGTKFNFVLKYTFFATAQFSVMYQALKHSKRSNEYLVL